MIRRSPVFFGILVCLLPFGVCPVASYQSQEDLRTKVWRAIDLPFPKDADESRKQLKQIGAPAVPFILEAIESEPEMNPIKKTFLVDVMASIHQESSVSGLMGLLSSNDPYIRGLAATYLGKQKVRASVPKLINLLNDKEVYKTTVYTDPLSEKPVLVRDAAIDALQAVTGKVLARRGTKDQKAQAWIRWWRTQQAKKRMLTVGDNSPKSNESTKITKAETLKKREIGTLQPCCHETLDGNERRFGNKRAAKRSTARLGAHQAWSRKFRSRLVRRKWMIRSVLLRLPDRPGLSEHSNKAVCSFGPVRNRQKLQTRERTSKRWPHLVSLRSSWFSPLVGELWLRVSLNDQDLPTLRNGDWFLSQFQRSRSSRSKRL